MAETITATPLRVRGFATKPMRRTFMLRSSLLKLRPLERLVRTMSPSRTSTRRPLSLSSCSTSSAMVVLPAPERPVNHNVNPRCLSTVLFSIPLSSLPRISRCVVYSHPDPREEKPVGSHSRPDTLAGLDFHLTAAYQAPACARGGW